jgi:hypothetical protein
MQSFRKTWGFPNMLLFRKSGDKIRGHVYEREILESESYETHRQKSTLANCSQTSKQTAPKDDDRSALSDTCESTTSITSTDEELALMGVPWAKEGMLCRKRCRESSGIEAKVKSWLDVFVVIQQGELKMFENWLVSVFMCRVTGFTDLHNENAHSIRTRRIWLVRLLSHIPWRTHSRLLATADSDHIAWC